MEDIRRNGSGYVDPTAHKAIKNVSEKEKEKEKEIKKVIKTLQSVAHLAGYNIEGRIALIDNKTGKVWR